MSSTNPKSAANEHGPQQAEESRQSFPGFADLTANFVYSPNQFFDVCLPHASRSTVRLVAYLLRRTLGWLDREGNPIEQEIRVSYREIIRDAGVSRGAIRKAIDEGIRTGFILCTEPGRANDNHQPARIGRFTLRWDTEGKYVNDIASFRGFYAGQGHRTPIPTAFFDRVVRCESLAVVKIVGAVLRHTVGYQNQFGGRRSQAPLSYTYIQTYAHMADRSTLSQAIRRAVEIGYMRRVEEGTFDPRRSKRNAATYAVRWLGRAKAEPDGSKTRPAFTGQPKIPTGGPNTVHKPDQERFKNQTSESPQIRPVERSRNPTTQKKNRKKLLKQQQYDEPFAVVASNSAGYRLLRTAGFDHKMATALSRVASADEIERQVEWLDRRNPQKNRLGMLRRAIEEQWAQPTTVDPPQAQRESTTREQQQSEIRTDLNRARAEKEGLRAARFSAWRMLSAKQKAGYFQQAIELAQSDFTRSRLRRHRELDNPPTEVLVLLTGNREAAAAKMSVAA